MSCDSEGWRRDVVGRNGGASGPTTSATNHDDQIGSLHCRVPRCVLNACRSGVPLHCATAAFFSRTALFAQKRPTLSGYSREAPDQRFDLFGASWSSCCGGRRRRRGRRVSCAFSVHRADRVGHEVVEGLGHDRRRGVGTVTTLADHAEHHVLGVAHRTEAHEPRVRFLAGRRCSPCRSCRRSGTIDEREVHDAVEGAVGRARGLSTTPSRPWRIGSRTLGAG